VASVVARITAFSTACTVTLSAVSVTRSKYALTSLRTTFSTTSPPMAIESEGVRL
jgi:hypothetical protein